MAELTTRQKEIIEVAIKLTSQGGIQQVTMKNIAKEIGVSEPAIYRHFESKVDILLSLLAQFKQRSEFQLKHARFFDNPGLILLETIFLEHARQFAAQPHMAAVVFSEEIFQNDARLAEEVFSIMTLAHETITYIIERSQERGEIRSDIPKEHLALFILGALRVTIKRWRLSQYAFDLEQELPRVWSSLKTLLS